MTNETAVAEPAADFQITALVYTATPSPAVRIIFPSIEGKNYAVDYSTGLQASGEPGGWTPLGAAFTAGSGGSTTFTDSTIAGTHPRVYYRVRQLP